MKTSNEQLRSRRLGAIAAVSVAALLGTVACVPEEPGPAPSTTSGAPTTAGPTTTIATTTTTEATTTTIPAPTPNQVALSGATSWLLGQFNASGVMPTEGQTTGRDLSNAIPAIGILAATGVGNDTLAQRLGNVESEFQSYVNDGVADRPAALGRLVLAVVAAGGNPRNFGGQDLVARIEATQRPNGFFGTQAANFDGAFRQGTVLAALSVVTPRPASITPGPGQTINDVPAVAWLLDQQCSDGSWMMYRASTATDCVENPAQFAYKDSNGAALATLGLAAVGATAEADPALWFAAVRGNDGGWGTSPSGATVESDANSTGLVIAALEALGQAPNESAYAFLRSLQVSASEIPSLAGAFKWKISGTFSYRLSTLDSSIALLDEVWPQALVP